MKQGSNAVYFVYYLDPLTPLPQAKVNAMDHLKFGVVDKIFLYFDKPFLAPEISEIILLWEDKKLDSVLPMQDRWYR
jgi:hypothetical protein